MSQYYIIEQRNLPAMQDHVEGAVRIGFLDFLRELQNDAPGFTQGVHLRVDGVEDVLLAARPNMADTAWHIHKALQRAASILDRRLAADVLIVIRNPIIPGATLRVHHPAAVLPLYLVFGTPVGVDIKGATVYPVSFNLSSA